MKSEINNLFSYEEACISEGLNLVAGVDEAGRGPLAGPVTAVAVICDFKKITPRVNDSKKLSDRVRRLLYDELKESLIDYKIVNVSETVIDEVNILNATKMAMSEAVLNLNPKPNAVLVDAVKLNIPFKTIPIIHGDALSYSIASASIIAKVSRDDYMLALSKEYPEYGFEIHKGYGTKHHIEMIKKFGACPAHRASFIKKFV